MRAMKKFLLFAFGLLSCSVLPGQEILFEPEKPEVFRNGKDGHSFRTNSDIAKPFTILVTFRMDPEAQYRKFKDLVSMGGERGPGFRITLFYGGLHFRTGDGKKVQDLSTPGTIRIHPGWNHAAFISSGESSSIILNGKVVKTGPFRVIPPKKAVPMVVGGYPAGRGYPLQGAVARFRFIPRVLTPEELADEYLNSLD